MSGTNTASLSHNSSCAAEGHRELRREQRNGLSPGSQRLPDAQRETQARKARTAQTVDGGVWLCDSSGGFDPAPAAEARTRESELDERTNEQARHKKKRGGAPRSVSGWQHSFCEMALHVMLSHVNVRSCTKQCARCGLKRGKDY